DLLEHQPSDLLEHPPSPPLPPLLHPLPLEGLQPLIANPARNQKLKPRLPLPQPKHPRTHKSDTKPAVIGRNV
ncbi:hypothetical protein ACHAXS_002068, partial [Conticribra weissflogii]